MGSMDSLTDVRGLLVGHAQRTGDGWLTGTTVVLAPEGGAVAAVDVRGGGPGTRETDALDPRNLVQRVEAVVLTGGSAYGLDAATGVAEWLEERRRGFRVGPHPAHVVPVVPAACLFDLGRGGAWRARPDAALGRAAAEAAEASGKAAGASAAPASSAGAASSSGPAGPTGPAAADPVPQGNVGAGTGAVAGGLKGGVGSASVRLPSRVTVGALAVVNAAGSVLHPQTGALYGSWWEGRPEIPDPAVHAEARRALEAAQEESVRRSATAAGPPLNTTLAVVATDAELTRAQAQKLAGTAHDGLARAVRPVHLLHDGDTVFALSTGTRTVEDAELNEVLAAGADALTRAVVRAVLSAESVDGPGGVFPAYRDLYRPA
ncbi:P1 family peptidase [Streptomyces sp. JJ36]|uniref:P1 family peptidase n=1 Tax=Streptomyces sp. JJ36 TaxID=2736645 RepID=UPI001F23964F|nr:P1 family peptidase [Streptomyces sp. JJ36]MCF6522314.1 P1 family peptidase [Streptomyces sp. JJ36]